MLTLGVHDGHTATAALFEDGEIIAAISEERLNRKKEWSGFPKLAIRKCLEITGKTAAEIEAVGFCSLMPQIGFDSYLKPHLHKKLFSYASKILPEKLLQSPKNIPRLQKLAGYMFKGRQREGKKNLLDLGIKTGKVIPELESRPGNAGHYTGQLGRCRLRRHQYRQGRKAGESGRCFQLQFHL
jgi:hypothetical protein